MMHKILEYERKMSEYIVGQQHIIRELFISYLAGWHILLEWAPGLWKTSIAKVFSKMIWNDFKRVQFTPDLLPSDILGLEIYNEIDREFQIKKWPIFSDILFVDEINRAGPKLQSALLESMEEKQVTLWNQSFTLPEDFMVIATANPNDHAGTFDLPYAQKDRFLFLSIMSHPSQDDEILIMKEHKKTNQDIQNNDFSINEIEEIKTNIESIHVSEEIYTYIKDVIFATREDNKISQLLESGLSSRASIALLKASKVNAFLSWRDCVLPEDVKRVIYPVLRHRLNSNYNAKNSGKTEDDIIGEILDFIPIV